MSTKKPRKKRAPKSTAAKSATPPPPERSEAAGGSQPADPPARPKATAARRQRAAADHGPQMGRATVLPELHDPKRREEWDLPAEEDEVGDYMIELNLLYKEGLEGANREFLKLYEQVLGPQEASERPATLVSKTYYRCLISVDEWREMLKIDEQRPRPERVIYRVWPDFPIKPLIDRSVVTVKADAAVRSYAATGAGIVWAVIDSGIDATHVHFGVPNPKTEEDCAKHTLLHTNVARIHRDFTGAVPFSDPANVASALTDKFGHGTHVAGIIAGGLSAGMKAGEDFQVLERVFSSEGDGANKRERYEPRRIGDPTALRGVAPSCKLVSLKVLDDNGAGRASNVMSALQYIREELNGDPKLLRVHGVNLSIGYEFDAEMFACGQSPLCVEVDRLVKSGVVVVVAAGNTGYGKVGALQRTTKVGLSNTINDPGNAALAITVGATHRDSPHIYGVSYFSSKGPTGDGRLKPDLVAPGERITSCAVGEKFENIGGDVKKGVPAYVDDTGTSMAAPHVSGAIAAFLSIRREFIQRPEEVKRIFLSSATPLGRERYFEGNGLIDLMRAIQSI
jgi:serine protease AprX